MLLVLAHFLSKNLRFFGIFEPAKVLEMKRKANSNGVGFLGV